MVPKVRKEKWVLKVNQAHKDQQDLKDHMENKEHQDIQALEGQRDIWEIKAK
jgi:hypothetical protein